jgi:deoxycytidine triphosphate deaminase
MYNFGLYPIRLADRMRVCQMVFEKLGEEPLREQTSQYRGQTGPRNGLLA